MIGHLRSAARKVLEHAGYRVTRDTTRDRIAAVRTLLAGVNKPLLLDVGARDGALPPWGDLHADNLVGLVLVEPDAEECARLQARHAGVAVLSTALGDVDAERTLHVTIMPGCSSLLEPDQEALRNFPVRAWFEVVDRRPVQVRRYDDLVRAGKAPEPAFIKLDVQGFEWNVLEGFGRVLEGVVAIELEAHFLPIYRGQKCAHDLIPYLREHDFALRHIERHGLFEEEFVEGNFFFSRRREGLSERDQAWLSAWEIACGIPPPLPFDSRRS